jgi:hypothetical protein
MVKITSDCRHHISTLAAVLLVTELPCSCTGTELFISSVSYSQTRSYLIYRWSAHGVISRYHSARMTASPYPHSDSRRRTSESYGAMRTLSDPWMVGLKPPPARTGLKYSCSFNVGDKRTAAKRNGEHSVRFFLILNNRSQASEVLINHRLNIFEDCCTILFKLFMSTALAFLSFGPLLLFKFVR